MLCHIVGSNLVFKLYAKKQKRKKQKAECKMLFAMTVYLDLNEIMILLYLQFYFQLNSIKSVPIKWFWCLTSLNFKKCTFVLIL